MLVNYYYTSDKNYSDEDGNEGLTMGYTKMDGLSYVDGQFVRNGNQVVGVNYLEKGGYADRLLDNAEVFSKEIANLGGGEITSLTPDTTGGSTVTGPVTADVVSWTKDSQLMENQKLAIAFENHYAYAYTDIGGVKIISGRTFRTGDSFTLELWEENGTAPIAEDTITPTGGGTNGFGFGMMEFYKQDIGKNYTYLVKERIPEGAVDGKLNGIIYDQTVYTVKLAVEFVDDELQVTRTYWKGTEEVEDIFFTNSYESSGEMTLDVEKVMNGRAFQSGDSFTFTVSAVSGVPMPERTLVTITPTEGVEAKVDFGKIEYTENDIDKTYTYTVKEVAGNQEGITYDDKFHTVTVKITDNGDGTLKVEPAYADGDRVILTNIYNADGELTLDVEKAMKGRSFREGDVFTFTVEAAEGVPMPEMAEVVIEPASGTTAKVDFGKITYSLADAGKTYVYTVKETAGSLSGVTYDPNAYMVEVQVADNGQGGLTVTPVYADGSRVTFVNTYAAGGEYQLTARKNLIGKDLADKQFTFVLRNEQGKEMETAVNDANGRIVFKAFRFNQNDIGKTYTYYVSERNGAQDGYIYDTTVYTVKLTVADNGDGTLTVEAAGIPDGGMVFENIFDNNTGVSFVKKWQGKEGPAITLTLYQERREDGSPARICEKWQCVQL